MNRRPQHWIVAILVLALALRVGLAVVMASRPLQGDELSYDQVAWNLASGHGYSVGTGPADRAPTASRGPGYVVPLAALYRVAGHHKLPMLLLQALLDTVSAWLVWKIGRRILDSAHHALGGALLYAVYPPFVISAAALTTETFVNLTLLTGLASGLEWALRSRSRALPVSGLAFGLCALCKPQLAPVAVLLVVAAVPRWTSRSFWIAVALQVGVVTAVLGPWIVRNAVVFHAFVPGVSLGGVTFWGGTGPDHGRTLGGLGEPGVPAHVLDATRGMSELDRDRWLYGEGVRVIREAPGRFALLMVRKLARLWLNLGFDSPPSRASLAVAAFNGAALLLCGWAARRLRPPAVAVRLLVALLLYFSVVHMIFFSVLRYAQPCYAYVFCFTGAGVSLLLGAVSRFVRSPEPVSGPTRQSP